MKIRKFKSWWNTLPYWKRGLISGFIFPFMIFVIGFLGKLLIPIYQSHVLFQGLIFVVIFAPFCLMFGLGGGHPPACALLGIFSPLLYGIIGLLIGIVFGKIKRK